VLSAGDGIDAWHERGSELSANRLSKEQGTHSRLDARRGVTGVDYAHPRNAFWPIMVKLFGAGPSLPYQKRVALLQSAGVALWDSLQACLRPGSLDASIADEAANDLPGFFDKHPNITHVFFNGMKAERAFRHHALPALTEDQHIFARLPSTSPAHAAMTLEAKVRAWCVVRKVLS